MPIPLLRSSVALLAACLTAIGCQTPSRPPPAMPAPPPLASVAALVTSAPPVASHDAYSPRDVLHDHVKPHWLPGNDRFWYLDDPAGGPRAFILVDAVKGVRGAAFDRARLAASLARATGTEVSAEHLPFQRIDFATDSSFRFSAEGKSWRCDTTTYALTEVAAPAGPGTGTLLAGGHPGATTRTGDPVDFVIRNRTKGTIALYWMTFDGQRREYGKIAPGGQQVQETYEGHIWVVTDADGGVLAAVETPDGGGQLVIDETMKPVHVTRGSHESVTGSPVASPDGHRHACVEGHKLWLCDAQGHSRVPLADEGTERDSYDASQVYWSPDSTRLVAIRTEKGDDRKVYLVESSPADQLQPKHSTYDYLKPGDRIPHPRVQLFDVATRRRIAVSDALFPNPWSVFDLAWTADSASFDFVYNQRGHQVLRVVSVDARTGVTRTIVEETSKTFVDYEKTSLARIPGTREMIWTSERDGYNHLYLVDMAQGRVKNAITHGAWAVRKIAWIDEVKRQIGFFAGGVRPGQDPYYLDLCRVGFDGTGFIVLTDGDGTHDVQYSPDRRFFVDSWSRVDLPPVSQLRDAADGRLIVDLERADIHRLLGKGWATPERFVAKGRDATTDIYGIIIRPAAFDPQKRYPVVEDIYAGPNGAWVPKAFEIEARQRVIADRGFVVVQIDGMGTSFRSKAFQDVAWKNLADSGFPDRIAWIKAAAARHPEMDLSRVGIYGGSAGGQSALRALLSHGDFYEVAVADSGCHDNRMDKIWWNELWMGWPVDDSYAKSSNVVDAHELKGKLLLVVGELDHNVDPSSTMQVVHALIEADKDFDLLVVPGGEHGVAETPYGQRRRADFFVQHLLGAP